MAYLKQNFWNDLSTMFFGTYIDRMYLIFCKMVVRAL